ncbi:MAG: inositol monophosphatase [Melioribacteraceae bacterium]|nr:inositol monophosphatase [Melioribacteraceae bacterium]
MIDKIITIAKEAGEVLREGFNQNFKIEFKTNEANLVTEYDKKSEDLIIDFINKEFPAHSVLAEESGASPKNSEYTWIIDPLDGTTNFAHGLPIFSVSIGLTKNKEIIAGAVYDVMYDKLYSAEKGSGAFCNGKKINVSKNDILGRSVLVTGFPYDIGEKPGKNFEIFTQFTKKTRAVRRLGSAAIDLCYVASGVFDAFWEGDLNAWDMCAGAILVEEAGGKVSNYKGEPIDIFNKQILASNGVIENRMIEVIKKCM